MLLIDLLRPYLVRHSLSNTLLVTALALPLTLLLIYSGPRIREWMPIQVRGRGWLLFAIGAPPLLALWLVSPLTQRIANLRGNPTLVLLLGLSPLLALWTLPVVSYFLAEVALAASRSTTHRQSRWYGVVSVASLCFCLLATNVGAPLLMAGGMPFNATHTLASWLFQMVWVNQDLSSGAAIGVLLGSGIFVVAGFGRYVSGSFFSDSRLKEEIGPLFLVGCTPVWLVAIPWICRMLGVFDGRWPLLLCDIVSTAWLLYWVGGVRGGGVARPDGMISQG